MKTKASVELTDLTPVGKYWFRPAAVTSAEGFFFYIEKWIEKSKKCLPGNLR